MSPMVVYFHSDQNNKCLSPDDHRSRSMGKGTVSGKSGKSGKSGTQQLKLNKCWRQLQGKERKLKSYERQHPEQQAKLQKEMKEVQKKRD